MNSSEKFNQELDDLLKRDYINEDSEFFDELKLARDIKNLQNPNNKVGKEIYNNMKIKNQKTIKNCSSSSMSNHCSTNHNKCRTRTLYENKTSNTTIWQGCSK